MPSTEASTEVTISFFDSKKPIENDFNFVFAIGGDGTILRSITYVKDSNIPILGINTGRLGFLTSIQKENIQGVNNLTPSYNKLIVSFDLKKTNFKSLKKKIEGLDTLNSNTLSGEKIEIPVCCDENFSLDIKRLEEKLKIDRENIYKNFFNKNFFCYMTGFIAGMPFLGDLDKTMRVKRLETPRVKVPKGSVGLTEQFANIYTFESPGGWNIIGNR